MSLKFPGALLALAVSFPLVTLSVSAHAAEERPVLSALPGSENGPVALSPSDRLTYTTAFDALRRGDLELARTSARLANDRVLLGQVEFERLFHRSHTATYDELAAWLEDYADLPTAPRVYSLALRRRPDGAPEPRRPRGVGGRTWDSVVDAGGGSTEDDPARAARVALNNDDLSGAVMLGSQIGDWWTVALAQYRLNDFSAAFEAFERVALDPTEDAWVRAGAAVWASKAAGLSGRQDRIQEYQRLAARWPATFYGQIALRQLGEEPAIENLGPRPYQAAVRQATYQPAEPIGVDLGELNAFIQSDPQARRTVAFYEVGRRTDAQSELRTGLRGAAGDTARRMWAGLARALRFNTSSDVTRIDATRYAQPVLEPEGGFTIEKALVYAIARKETGFDPEARSGAGAFGIMQVMPTTAAELTGDRGFATDPQRLLVPATNIRLGQAYINKMLALPAFRGDVLRAVASYNAGPGPMLSAIRKLGPDADPLLLIETIDVPQARQYVEEVMAAYWIYQRMFGGPLNTLDAVAGGARLVPIGLDYVAPLPTSPMMASVAPPVGAP
ncbi:soluble lytic murein transglycosylase-like protein [Brevundimonas variabilis]|uniref:Soluble lytic murein transglycosylase-like protein n=1 Tax=Brevundimonas variabilis TaxID=74312 RepID=A0A7W9CJA8_9CAUL|nr:soluble lytic murein transglycosylase-like protein [Brevundimonas variabilis]